MASFLPVDFTKSIQKQKLIYKRTSKSVFEYVLFYGIILAVAFPSVIMIYDSASSNSIYSLVFILLFDLWITANIILMNHFVIVDGKDREQNKQNIIKVLTDLGITENLNTTQPNMVRDFRGTSFFDSGRTITCLLANGKVYINITSLLRGNGFSIFSGFFNYFICKNIARQFKKTQASH